MTVGEFNKRFKYKADKGEKWTFLKEPPYEGDCEDYALTVAWILSDQSMWKFWWNIITLKMTIWYCRTPRKRGHVMLRYNDQWIDNITKKFSDDTENTIYFTYTAPLLALKLLIH